MARADAARPPGPGRRSSRPSRAPTRPSPTTCSRRCWSARTRPGAAFLLRIAIVDGVCGELADALTGERDGERAAAAAGGRERDARAARGPPGLVPLPSAAARPAARRAARGRRGELRGAAPPAARWLAEAGWVRGRDPPRAGRPATASWRPRWSRTAGSSCYLDGGLATLRSLVDMLPGGRSWPRRRSCALAARGLHVEDGDAGGRGRRAGAGRERAGPAAAPARRTQFPVTLAVATLRRRAPGRRPADGLRAARRLIGDASRRSPRRACSASRSPARHRGAVGRRARARGRAPRGRARRGADAAGTVRRRARARPPRRRRLARGPPPAGAERARTAVDCSSAAARPARQRRRRRTASLAGIEYLWDDLDAAARTLGARRRGARGRPERPLRALIVANRTRLMHALGDAEGALATLRSSGSALGGFAHPQLERRSWRRSTGCCSTRSASPPRRASLLGGACAPAPRRRSRVALARLRLADGEPGGRARRSCARLLGGEEPGVLFSTRVQAHAVDALAHDALLGHEAAAAELRSGLDLAEPRGLRRVLIELGPALRPVLRRERCGARPRTARSSTTCSTRSTARPASPGGVAPLRAAERARDDRAAVPADDDVQPGDRLRAVRVGEHAQDAPQADLPQARRREPPRRGRARAGHGAALPGPGLRSRA